MGGQSAPGAQFKGLTNLRASWRKCWLELWAPQDGRFQTTPLVHGEPKDKRWETIYWIGQDITDAYLAARLLSELGYGYAVLLDTFDWGYVVLTDYQVSAFAQGRVRRSGTGHSDQGP